MCVTAHESGCVLFHTLEMASDPGLYKARSECSTKELYVCSCVVSVFVSLNLKCSAVSKEVLVETETPGDTITISIAKPQLFKREKS